MTVKLPNVRNNLLKEMNPNGIALLKKACAFNKSLLATEKWSKKRIFLIVKEYGRLEFSSNQVLIFVSVFVVVSLTSIFLF